MGEFLVEEFLATVKEEGKEDSLVSNEISSSSGTVLEVVLNVTAECGG